jgi:outer membrane protein OmpA-like peptidoglycan-associated protein
MTMKVSLAGSLSLAAVLSIVAGPVLAAEIQPHRALYGLSLDSAKPSGGVLGANGAMTYEWGETCGGWTVEQRFRLRLEYADQDAAEISSNLVTWESKDGTRYRFNERRLRNGEVDEEIRGEAHLNQTQTYMLGFEGNGSKLNASARSAVEEAVASTRKGPGYQILVVGRGGGSENGGVAKSEEERLAKLRTEAVRTELIRAGVPAATIKLASGGAQSIATPTAQDLSGPNKTPERRVEIVLEPNERSGAAEFTKPEQTTIPLKADTLFPTAHTLFLIDRAQAGDQFVVRNVFDGTTVDDATMISAVIGPTLKPGLDPQDKPIKNTLLLRPSWHMRLAFFPSDSKSEEPDYELGMRLLDNGVSQNMALDYGDYVVRAELERIEPLPKPAC